MPSPERRGGRNPEQEQPSYYQAARFSGESLAGQAYFHLQEAIFEANCDLSSYRLQLNRIWHVVALGEPPPEDLDKKVKQILSAGEPTSLSSDVLRVLNERRAQATKQSRWVERHFRPGKHL